MSDGEYITLHIIIAVIMICQCLIETTILTMSSSGNTVSKLYNVCVNITNGIYAVMVTI